MVQHTRHFSIFNILGWFFSQFQWSVVITCVFPSVVFRNIYQQRELVCVYACQHRWQKKTHVESSCHTHTHTLTQAGVYTNTAHSSYLTLLVRSKYSTVSKPGPLPKTRGKNLRGREEKNKMQLRERERERERERGEGMRGERDGEWAVWA